MRDRYFNLNNGYPTTTTLAPTSTLAPTVKLLPASAITSITYDNVYKNWGGTVSPLIQNNSPPPTITNGTNSGSYFEVQPNQSNTLTITFDNNYTVSKILFSYVNYASPEKMSVLMQGGTYNATIPLWNSISTAIAETFNDVLVSPAAMSQLTIQILPTPSSSETIAPASWFEMYGLEIYYLDYSS